MAEPERAHGVVGEHLADLVKTFRHRLLEPVPNAIVQARALELRQRVIGDITDDHVPDAEGTPRRIVAVALQEAPADEILGRRPRHRAELQQLVGAEAFAHYAGCLEDALLIGSEAVDSRGDDGVNRFGQVQLRCRWRGAPPSLEWLEHAVVDQHPKKLLAEEGVAGRAIGNLRRDDGRKLLHAKQARQERLRSPLIERFESNDRCVLPGGRPAGMALHQLGSRHADEKEGNLGGRIGKLADDLDRRRVRPLEVVDEHDDWLLCGHRLEILPNAPAEFHADALGCNAGKSSIGILEPKQERDAVEDGPAGICG